MKKHLYSYHYSQIQRYEITRESDKSYWVRYGMGEQLISKKYMRIGNRWNSTHFEEENEQLKSKWELQDKWRRYSRKLDELAKCKDMSIVDIILAIEVPKIQSREEKHEG